MNITHKRDTDVLKIKHSIYLFILSCVLAKDALSMACVKLPDAPPGPVCPLSMRTNHVDTI